MYCFIIRRLGIVFSLSVATLLALGISGSASATESASITVAAEAAKPSTAESAAAFIEFVLEDEANCQSRESQHVIVHNIHPTRAIRVWLDRYYRNVPTGDRSRSDLLPGAEPEGLGCATVMNARQEWRVVRAVFLD
jgi:hypothetical protein